MIEDHPKDIKDRPKGQQVQFWTARKADLDARTYPTTGPRSGPGGSSQYPMRQARVELEKAKRLPDPQGGR